MIGSTIFRYKIVKPFLISLVQLLVLITVPMAGMAQNNKLNKYGLRIIQKCNELEKMVVANSDNSMQDVHLMIPSIQIELKYASEDNFMKQKLYAAASTTYLRAKAIRALILVQQSLHEKGFGLKIWDAYRPYAVTEKMWELVKDDRYAANPAFGSGHNRGTAVDLTIIELSTKKELDMGTGFDHFSDTAHVGFKGLPVTVLQNRLLLQKLMEQNGFIVLDTEWWHFYLPDSKKYELLNLSFKQLKKINNRGSR